MNPEQLQRIVEIQEELGALSEVERERRLIDLEVSEPSIAAAVRSLLDGFFSPTIPSPLPLRAGDEFGQYRLLTAIGEGGFGQVWKVEDEVKGRVEALKVVKPSLAADTQLIARFKEEIASASQLEHDNVVRVYNAGEVNDRLYYTMQFIEGKSLQDRVRAVYSSTVVVPLEEDGDHQSVANTRKPSKGTPVPTATFDQREAARYVMQAALGVACAHQAGFIHRDIKPANLMVSRRSEGNAVHERVLVADFGLAKVLRADGEVSAERAGTPAYMAPEQRRGIVGTRSDIYSLGASLVALLVGLPPRRPATSVDRLAGLVDIPIRAIDFDLEVICLKSLQERPERRYDHADDLARDLDNYLSHRPIAARPRSRWQVWNRRRGAKTS